MANVISGSGNLTQAGAGTLILAGANTYLGTTSISAGTLQVGNAGATGNLGGGNVIDGTSLVFNRSDALTLPNAISGSGSLTQAGAGTLILTGANTYGGSTTISAGVLQIGNGGITGALGAGAVTDATALVFNRSDAIIVANAISGAGTLTQNGAGTLILTGNNSYLGATAISTGVLEADSANALGAVTAGTAINSGATLRLLAGLSFPAEPLTLNGPGFDPGTGAIGALTTTGAGSTAFAGPITIATSATISSGGGDLVLTGGITKNGTTLTLTGGGSITISSLGIAGASANSDLVVDATTVNLNAPNTYNGPTLVKNAGVLRIGANNILPQSPFTNMTLNAAGTLDLNSFSDTVASLAGDDTGIVKNVAPATTSTLTLSPAAGSTTFAGIISGTAAGAQGDVALVKAGAGTQILSGNNTYTGGTTISAGVLQIGDGGTSGTIGGGNVTDDASLVLNRSDTLTLANAISGAGSLTQAGTGATILTAGNSYGDTTISAGTLQVGNGGTTGSLGTGNVSDNASLVFNRSDTVLVPGLTGGVISGAGSVTQAGTGTLIFTNDNSYTGGTTINPGGMLQVGNAGTTGNLGGGNVTDNGALVVNRADTFTFLNAISGSGSLTQAGAGTTILLGNNSYSGGTLISAGALQVGDGGVHGSLGTGPVTDDTSLVFNRSDTLTVPGAIGGAGSLTQAGTGATILLANNTYTGGTTITAGALQLGNGGTAGNVGPGAVTDNGSLVFNRSDTLTVGGAIDGTGSLTQAGAGTLILTGDNTYAGGTTIAAGTLQLGNGGTTGALGSGPVIDNAALVVNHSNPITLANAISGAGSLAQIGAGPLTLTADNSYAGGTTIAPAATLQAGNGGATGSVGSGNVADDGSLVINRSADLALGAVISGTGSVTQSGAGTTTLSGLNTYTGPTTVSNGTLSVASLANGSSPSGLGASSSAASNLVINGGTLRYTGPAASTERLFTLGLAGGTLDGSGSGAITFAGPGAVAFSGPTTPGTRALILSGSTTGNVFGLLLADNDTANGDLTALTKSGPGSWIITANNTYTGATTINAGSLQLGNGGATGSLGAGAVTDNGNLTFNRSGAVSVGAIDGSGSLTQAGTGTLILAADNTYSGGTTINPGGTIQVGNGGSAGTLGSGPVTDNGALVINRGDVFTLANNVTGTGTLTQTGGGLIIITGSVSSAGGTTVSSGELQVATGGALAGNLTNNGAFTLIGGTYASGGTLTNNGTFNYNAGNFNGNLTNKGVANLNAPFTLSGSFLNPTGAPINGAVPVTITPTGSLSGFGLLPASSVDNAGTVTAHDGNLVISAPTFTNSGTIANDPGGSLFIQAATLNNTGNVSVNAGGGVYVSAPLEIVAGKTLSMAGGTVGAPAVNVHDGGAVSGSGQFASNLNNIPANLNNAGTVNLNGPTQLFGNLANAANGAITVRNSQFLVTGAADNQGTIRTVSGGSVAFDGGLTGNPPGPSAPVGGPLPSAPILAGHLLIDANGSAVANFVRQNKLTMNGTAGNPASYGKLGIRHKADGGATSVVNSLTVQTDGGGTPLAKLDIADTALIVNYGGGASPLANVRSLIISGYSGGTWNGDGGITSSVAAENPSARAIGYAEGSEIVGPSGGTFEGQAADAASVLARFTIPGDANLDGTVDFSDLVKLAQNYGNTVSATTESWWTHGDFNYDGTVDFVDLVKLAQNYNGSVTAAPAVPSLAFAGVSFQQDLAAAFSEPAAIAASFESFSPTAVPEPGALSLLAIGALALLRRRR
jgi:fibronectin-binding autotransporter adhesin